MEGGEQGRVRRVERHRGCEVVRPQAHAVLGHQQGDAGEVAGQQARQGGRAAGRGVAEVDSTEAVVLVPVEGERAQGAFEVRGDGEQIGYARLAGGAVGAGRTTGAFQRAYGGFGAERSRQAALVAGEFGESVQRVGETVRLGGRRTPARDFSPEVDAPPEPDALPDAPHSTAASSPKHSANRRRARRPRRHPVVLGRPQRRGAHPADLRRQRDPALVLLVLAATERVDVELVLCEPAHQPVAPEPGVTAHIRIATLRKQSDAHECTPDLPYGEPPLPGGSQRDERMRTRRWCDGRLSVAPPKGVNGRNFPVRVAFRRARRSNAHASHANVTPWRPTPVARPGAARRPRGSSAGTAARSCLVYGSRGDLVHLVDGPFLDDPARAASPRPGR